MDDLTREFIEETQEALSEIEHDLVEMERSPSDPDRIDRLFRIVHTIKGTCGFIGLERLGTLAHAAENVLGLLRDRELDASPAVISEILLAMDRIRDLLAGIQAEGTEPDLEVADLIGRLEEIAAGPSTVGSEEEAAWPADAAAEAGDDEEFVTEDMAEPEEAEAEAPSEAPANPLFSTLAEILGGVVGDDADESEEAEAPPPARQETPARPLPAKQKAAAAVETDTETPKASEPAQGSVQSLRVHVDLLEQLMTLVSELVLTRNQLMQLARNQSDSIFHLPLQRLSQVTSELQEGVMKTRMQPIGNAWNKLPRIVRDLSLELGKKIELHMEGAETELDRQVLDMIKDPLTHMVRNSADHGIEMPDERRRQGKPESGSVRLSARHEGGHIVIDLNDDGRGLNAEAIRRRIVERGLVSSADAEDMTDQRLFRFIFAPGFSTAEAVTSVSGRGVGMDVVRTNIERIGGSIDLQSEQGAGTRVTVKIPLTLAIVSALIVESAGEKFAIPQISVQELVRVNGTSQQQIEEINGACLLRLRERLLPLIYLGRVLELDDQDMKEVLESRELFVVVTQLGAQEFGIIVDRVYDTEEIVVKPVAPILRDIKMFSGNTILGDGSVIMILDPNGLATTMSAKAIEAAEARDEAEDGHDKARKVPLLIFSAGGKSPKAVPLSLVDRLEEFDEERFETLDDRTVVQYRGALMPVVGVHHDGPIEAKSRQPVIVFSDLGACFGLAVDRIIDIGEEELKVDLGALTGGCMGTAVIYNKATEVLDVSHYLSRAYPERYGENNKPYTAERGREPTRILMVDDSGFFRTIVGSLVRSRGWRITAVEHPEKALALLDDGQSFDVIVSDIELPGMDGYELLRRLRAHPASCNTPVVALSSHGSAVDRERGERAGFSAYVAKLDKNRLLDAIEATTQDEEIAA